MNKLKKHPWKKAKLKLNFENSYVMRILIFSCIFIIIDTIFLFIITGNKIAEFSSSKPIIEIKNSVFGAKASTYSSYLSDSLVIVVLLITTILGKRKIEYGYLFPSLWMVVLSFLLIFPFAVITPSLLSILRLVLLLIPGALIYVVMFKFMNDLKWMRRSKNKFNRRAMYV